MGMQKRLSMLSKLAGIFAGGALLLRNVFIRGVWLPARHRGAQGMMAGMVRWA